MHGKEGGKSKAGRRKAKSHTSKSHKSHTSNIPDSQAAEGMHALAATSDFLFSFRHSAQQGIEGGGGGALLCSRGS